MSITRARFAGVVALTLSLGTTSSRAADAVAITDKTFVAWVALADLVQRAGSVVTLIDRAERFDALVFAEAAPGKWMPGSDFFHRTRQDQAAWPLETAGAGTYVQLALVYRGNEITLYRNGQEYAAYTIDAPQPFGADGMALLGLRYIGEGGEIGYLKGAIDDVRIYDRALTAAEVAALVPNRAGEPRPLAWWSFEDGSARDAMGSFAAVKVEGGARIAEGKLVLDGTGYVWAARDARLFAAEEEGDTDLDAREQTMFFNPRSRLSGMMWDTWLYFENGVYYLYYLARSRSQWDNISMAISKDGVHWRELGRVLKKGRGVTWVGTGSTWKAPDFAASRRYCMNFSEWKGPRQTIFFAVSKDLRAWTRLGDEYEFVQDERWYEREGRWDCIWTLARPGGGLYGYFTATPKSATGGRFGFAESQDGVAWRALESPKVEGVGEGEVGAIEKIGNAYYMLFGTGGIMATLVAEKPEGPFRAAAKNRALLAGHTYFARFFPTPGGLLVNHHAIARDGHVYFGALKRAALDAEGTLRLAWWEGNEAMKHRPIEIARVAADDGAFVLGKADNVAHGLVVEGTLALPADSAAERRGFFFECADKNGAAALFDANGIAELGTMRSDGSGFAAEKRVDRAVRFGAPARVRFLLKGSLLELYLDDVLIECFSLPGNATGRVRPLPQGDSNAAVLLKAWRA
jgi:hypothetical protein